MSNRNDWKCLCLCKNKIEIPKRYDYFSVGRYDGSQQWLMWSVPSSHFAYARRSEAQHFTMNKNIVINETENND